MGQGTVHKGRQQIFVVFDPLPNSRNAQTPLKVLVLHLLLAKPSPLGVDQRTSYMNGFLECDSLVNIKL